MNSGNNNSSCDKSIIGFNILTKTFLSKKKKKRGKYSSIYQIQQNFNNSSKNQKRKTNIHAINATFNKNHEKFRCANCKVECICFVSSKVKFHEEVHIFNGKNIMIKKLSGGHDENNSHHKSKETSNENLNIDIDVNVNVDVELDCVNEDDEVDGIDYYNMKPISKRLHDYSTYDSFSQRY